MTTMRDPDRLIAAFLDEGSNELPDRAYDGVRAEIEHTRQRFVFGPWREQQIMNATRFALAAAAVVLVAVVGFRFLPGLINTGPGATPTVAPTAPSTATPHPTETPQATPAPTPAPIADPNGPIRPGTYVVHPFADSTMSFSFTVVGDGWEADQGVPGQTIGIAKDAEAGGVGLGFLRVRSTNHDGCRWNGTANDDALGPTVDDLVTRLESGPLFSTPDLDVIQRPMDADLGGYTGRLIRVSFPDIDLAECDEGAYRIWNADGFDIYAQGPLNQWDLHVLDVDGERVVVVVSDFENTGGATRDELRQIRASLVITP